jgi:hypothetical protein
MSGSFMGNGYTGEITLQQLIAISKCTLGRPAILAEQDSVRERRLAATYPVRIVKHL